MSKREDARADQCGTPEGIGRRMVIGRSLGVALAAPGRVLPPLDKGRAPEACRTCSLAAPRHRPMPRWCRLPLGSGCDRS